jgi:hypothetical protein
MSGGYLEPCRTGDHGQMRSQRFALVTRHLPICVFDPRIVCDRLARNDNVVDDVRWAQISSPRERAALQLDITHRREIVVPICATARWDYRAAQG